MTGPISNNVLDREIDKFVESPTRANKTAVEVFVGNGGEISGGLLAGVVYDYGTVAYPTTTKEIYSFYSGGVGGTLVATVTLNYADSQKENLSTFEVIK